jgi:hypothetical protein
VRAERRRLAVGAPRPERVGVCFTKSRAAKASKDGDSERLMSARTMECVTRVPQRRGDVHVPNLAALCVVLGCGCGAKRSVCIDTNAFACFFATVADTSRLACVFDYKSFIIPMVSNRSAFRLAVLALALILFTMIWDAAVYRGTSALPLSTQVRAADNRTHHLPDAVAAALNYTQFEYTLANSLYKINPHICLNYALSVAAANLADLLTYCTPDQVGNNSCSALTPGAIARTLLAAGWTSTNIQLVDLAAKVPARYFNWSTSDGLSGLQAYHVGLQAAPYVVNQLRPYLHSGQLNLVGVGAVALRTDYVYAMVALGGDPSQHCYEAS